MIGADDIQGAAWARRGPPATSLFNGLPFCVDPGLNVARPKAPFVSKRILCEMSAKNLVFQMSMIGLAENCDGKACRKAVSSWRGHTKPVIASSGG